ncbi:MAG: hypothetical protein ABI600_02555 [Luteolibacter sp.]
MKTLSHHLAAAFLFLHLGAASAQVPQIINYQGRVSVGGVNFSGTGQFKFALVDGGITFGTRATATAVVTGGVVTAVNVDNPGTNYASPPPITFSGPGIGATATAHLNLGIVDIITVSNGGTGYVTAPTVTIAAPSTIVIYDTLWSHDATSNGGQEPTTSVAVPVVNGLYSVALGGNGMAPFYEPIFGQQLYLRVWFNDGVHGFQQLTPDQKLAAAPYALRAKLAETVPNGSIGAVALVDGAVSSTKLAAGAVDSSKLATGTAEAIVQSGLGSGVAAVNSGVVLSADPASSALAAAGYVKIGSQSFTAESWAGQTLKGQVPQGLVNPQALWVGAEMFVFGNLGSTGPIGAFKFNPVSNVWTYFPTSGGSMQYAKMVRAGDDILFWGLDYTVPETLRFGVRDGLAFNPMQGTWRSLSQTNQPSQRFGFSAVWTGSRMIVWGGVSRVIELNQYGGYTFTGQDQIEPNGGLYDPVTNIWTTFTGGPTGRVIPSATWTGTEMVVWGGADWLPASSTFVVRNTGAAYNPDAGTWRDLNTSGAPPARYGHSAVLAGSLLHIFGGSAEAGGATYDLAQNTWASITSAGAPDGRYLPAAAWTGNEVAVWGGGMSASPPSPNSPTGGFSNPVNTGARYNRTTNSWTPIAAADAPVARVAAASAWSGSKLIVFGGGSATGAWLGTGATWEAASNTWSAITDGAVHPGKLFASVWTGTELILTGGMNAAGQMGLGARFLASTSAYSELPTLNAPSIRTGHSAVWTGTEMIVWGGINQTNGTYPAAGARFNPNTNEWIPMSTLNSPALRQGHTAVWTGTEMIVWGGTNGAGGATLLDTGARYNPASDTWQPLSTAGTPPTARYDHTAVWTGSEMVVWGGVDGGGVVGNGARFNLGTGQWTALSFANAPSARSRHTATWTGTEMIVCGGLNLFNAGSRYSPSTDSWTLLPEAGAPSQRIWHSAVWSGSDLLVWGGRDGAAGTVRGDGARFSVQQNAWLPITSTGAAPARHGHTAVWAGSGMIVLFGQKTDDSYPADAFRYSPPATVHYYLKLNP